MNANTARRYLPLVQALAEGKVVQFKYKGKWIDGVALSFYDAPENYRIKPDPLVVWINVRSDGVMDRHAYQNEHSAKMLALGSQTPRKFIEA